MLAIITATLIAQSNIGASALLSSQSKTPSSLHCKHSLKCRSHPGYNRIVDVIETPGDDPYVLEYTCDLYAMRGLVGWRNMCLMKICTQI